MTTTTIITAKKRRTTRVMGSLFVLTDYGGQAANIYLFLATPNHVNIYTLYNNKTYYPPDTWVAEKMLATNILLCSRMGLFVIVILFQTYGDERCKAKIALLLYIISK